MLKLENFTILVLIVLAHQINGIYSQGKAQPFHSETSSKKKNFFLLSSQGNASKNNVIRNQNRKPIQFS